MKIGFVGLGNMGGPMARNLLTHSHDVIGYDVAAPALAAHASHGGRVAGSAAEAARDVDIVVTMLPSGRHVSGLLTGPDGLIAAAAPGTLLIDCSTIDVDTARTVAAAAGSAGLEMLDAPVSGGVGGAQAGTLTFMVGGADASFARALPVLHDMGKTVVHAGRSGSGQAAKICNNMVLGISMIGVCEAFALAEKLGLDSQKLFDISSKSSGQCWSLTSNCPVPGPVPASPANRDYKPGFAAALMLKDLKLAQQAADSADASTPLGAEAANLYAKFVDSGHGNLDFSGIIGMLRGRA
jgi:3-hydroxyisobutyrate dehydrogenase